MIEPADYGLDDVQTFAHIGDPTPAPDHSVFWKHWYARLVAHTPVLNRRTTIDPSDPSATHEFVSNDGVRIGATIVLPGDAKPVRASLVSVHGYNQRTALGDSARRWQRVADTGVAVLILRLRGYPGSQLGIGEQRSPDESGAGWIARGFAGEKHEDWILPGAIADVCNACRVMRNALLDRDTDTHIPIDPAIDHPGIFLMGSSLGGGLASIAGAQLIGKLSGESIIDRLAIALPSLGAWRWRLAHQLPDQSTGTTADIKRVLARHPEREKELIDRLRLCDAVVHGRRGRVPTLGMLARRDEIAPAPSAAAVFNAIDADPGRKWRFVVPYGHFEGSIPNARRHALFERAMIDFFNPTCQPIESMEPWEPILHDGVAGPDGQEPPLDDQHTTESTP